MFANMAKLLEILPVLFDSDSDSDEDTILLFSTNIDKTSTLLLPKAESFDFNSFSDDFCKYNFRFLKDDILRLKSSLKIPYTIVTDTGVKVPGLEALCILLKRLAYPIRFVDLMKTFPRSVCQLSYIFKHMINFIDTKHGHLITNLRQPYLNDDTIKGFSESIYDKGSPYQMCIGFLDGTVRPICRPQRNQKEFYNGHRRVHALKCQSVMFPNGLIGNMHGPVSGRRHDAYILHESGLIQEMQNFKNEEGTQYYVYGDPAYPLRNCVMVPFKGSNVSMIKRRCNKRMSRVRESVEWGFAKVIQLFAFLDYKKNLKIGMQPVWQYYKVGTILTNCHTCLYGSQVAEYFDCIPPLLEEYVI